MIKKLVCGDIESPPVHYSVCPTSHTSLFTWHAAQTAEALRCPCQSLRPARVIASPSFPGCPAHPAPTSQLCPGFWLRPGLAGAWQGPSSSSSGYPWHSLQLQLQGSLFSFGCLLVLLSATGSASSGAGLLLCLSSCASLGKKMYQSRVSPDIATTVPVHALGPFAFRGECFAEILLAGRGRQGSHFASQATQRVGGTLYGAVFLDPFLFFPTMSVNGYVWKLPYNCRQIPGPPFVLVPRICTIIRTLNPNPEP